MAARLGGPRYLVRLDDACDTFHREKWEAVEHILNKLGIRPIVAVIPNNEDGTLFYADRIDDFWQIVRNWKARGWHIALHGNRHVYHRVDKQKLLFPFYDRSEFAGLDLEAQSNLLRDGLAVFKREGLTPTVWVAPSHSFNRVTLDALKRVTDIRLISDGIAFTAYRRDAFIFFPQQLWWPRIKRFGLWTICLHPNAMSWDEIESFEATISGDFFKGKFAELVDEIRNTSQPGLPSWLYAQFFWLKWNLKAKVS